MKALWKSSPAAFWISGVGYGSNKHQEGVSMLGNEDGINRIFLIGG
ncbi:hypothetical Protein YC6258_02310 [Gynuella sunshinyii YC6258]|uniref:Uncharacterized protein n=1 Tax=Gynuella sunshinyii YC6258 TaxID=1445510 RepID=A0A0C5VLW7_9GAMM|nr:hypothetical Protein YC6258_02310 [Gynuella sunshinyii YC6258]